MFDRQSHFIILVTVVKRPHKICRSFISLNLILCIQNLFDLLVLAVRCLYKLDKLLYWVRYLVFVRSVDVGISFAGVGCCSLPLILCGWFICPFKDYATSWFSWWSETFLWCTSMNIVQEMVLIAHNSRFAFFQNWLRVWCFWVVCHANNKIALILLRGIMIDSLAKGTATFISWSFSTNGTVWLSVKNIALALLLTNSARIETWTLCSIFVFKTCIRFHWTNADRCWSFLCSQFFL